MESDPELELDPDPYLRIYGSEFRRPINYGSMGYGHNNAPEKKIWMCV